MGPLYAAPPDPSLPVGRTRKAVAAWRRTRRRRIALVAAVAIIAPAVGVLAVVTQVPLPQANLAEPGPVRTSVGGVLVVPVFVVALVLARRDGTAARHFLTAHPVDDGPS